MMKKGKGTGMRHLSLTMVLVAMLFGLALFMPGEVAYASHHPHPHPENAAPYGEDEAKVRIVKLDQDGNPVKGATMELWRIQIPQKYYDEDYYNNLLEQLEDNEKKVERVDKWVTDGKEHVVDLSNYYPSDYSPGSAPYYFAQYDNRYDRYNSGYYPFCYMLIETDTPGNYMTAEKTFFRVDPEISFYNGNLYSYNIRHYRGDPRQSELVAGYASTNTQLITAVDTKAPLLVDKLDQNGKHLKGAELELLDDKGNPVLGTDGKPVKWTSSGKTDQLWIKRPSYPDADAKAHGGGPVNYTIREISAPEGYDKSKDVTFKLYPCGRWDYAEGSEPAIGHKPTESQTTGSNDGQQPSVVPSPCQPPPVVDPVMPATPSGKTIPYVYTDPVRVIDFKVKKENGVEVGDFTVNKTDQDGEPLSEVAFEVYGKPKLTTTVNVDVTKHWEYEGATTVTNAIGPEEHALGDTPQEQYVEQQQQEDGDGSQQQESQVPEHPVLPGPEIFQREGNEKSFPYDFMANLTPKVTIKAGNEEIGTMTGTPLKDILGDAFDKAQNNGEKTEGSYVTYTDSEGVKRTVQGAGHWYYKGSADEKLGTFNLKDGEVVVVSEDLEGSLAGTALKIERERLVEDYDVSLGEWVQRPQMITYFEGEANAGGIGNLGGISLLNTEQYNKFDRPIPTNVLRHFGTFPMAGAVYGNLVRHIAPQPVVIEFKDGKLMLTDQKGTRDITDSCEVIVDNIVQWRTELGPTPIAPPPVVCPPKWK